FGPDPRLPPMPGNRRDCAPRPQAQCAVARTRSVERTSALDEGRRSRLVEHRRCRWAAGLFPAATDHGDADRWRMKGGAGAAKPADASARARGSSFNAAMRILPRPRREAMFEIYSFCRAVDDIADEVGPRHVRRQALAKWRRDIGALYKGGSG